MKTLLTILLGLIAFPAVTAQGKVAKKCGIHSDLFTRNANFTVPERVTSVRVVVVGGGGGGTNGNAAGGGSGYVTCATIRVQSCEEIPITVGGGGRGAKEQVNSDEIDDCQPGYPSAFGRYLSAQGGGACNLHGNAGGSGSGAPCLARVGGKCKKPNGMAGAGGSGGSDGGKASDGKAGGRGQGPSFMNCLKSVKVDELTPGAGGAPGQSNCKDWASGCWGASGGGGGVLVNGLGPSGYEGRGEHLAGQGGKGHGSGGGGGGVAFIDGLTKYYAGGNGEDGIVFVEWD